MRDPKRIATLLDKIKELWEKVPDWRFGQLLINLGLVKDSMNTWNAEYEDIMGWLEKQEVIK